MVSARTVAHYILSRRSADGRATTTYALQKLLYFCKGWSLVSADDPLFREQVTAWGHGPVVDDLWPACRGKHYISSDEIPESTDGQQPSEGQKRLINRVLDMFSDIDDSKLGDTLEALSHKQGPWVDARPVNGVINDTVIKSYFESLQADPPEDQRKYVPVLADLSHRTIISDEDMDWLEKTFALPMK